MKEARIVVVGDKGVGKTAMIHLWADAEIVENLPDVLEPLDWVLLFEGVEMRLLIFDTSSLDRQQRLNVYKGADVVIICYAVHMMSSLYNVEASWIPEVKEWVPEAKVILMGLQLDRYENKQEVIELGHKNLGMVSWKHGCQVKERIGACYFYEASIFTSSSVISRTFGNAIEMTSNPEKEEFVKILRKAKQVQERHKGRVIKKRRTPDAHDFDGVHIRWLDLIEDYQDQSIAAPWGWELTELPIELQELKPTLTHLSLNNNSFDTLPDWLSSFHKLTKIGLTKNKLKSIPDALLSLPGLTELYLSANLLETLPPDFGNLTTLESLQLMDNKLKTLPPSIQSLTNLKFLCLSRNQLTALPSQLGKCSSLRELHLTDNHLASIPLSLRSLPHWKTIAMSSEFSPNPWLSESEERFTFPTLLQICCTKVATLHPQLTTTQHNATPTTLLPAELLLYLQEGYKECDRCGRKIYGDSGLSVIKIETLPRADRQPVALQGNFCSESCPAAACPKTKQLKIGDCVCS